jgi:hypothetical protein
VNRGGPPQYASSVSQESSDRALDEAPDEALVAETVLWAVKGMSAAGPGVSAEDVARFLSKDTTLSAKCDRESVAALLDSLVAEGELTYDAANGVWSTDDGLGAVFAEPHWGVDAERATTEGHAGTDLFLRLRVEQLERDRSDLGTDRDEWRQRAESAQEEASGAHSLGDELRTRLGELEQLLEEERASGEDRVRLRLDQLERERNELRDERDEWRRRAESAEADASDAHSLGDELRTRLSELEHTTRRAADALARAQRELEWLEATDADEAAPSRPAPSRSTPPRKARGNWLM